jgi:hypothetical protein
MLWMAAAELEGTFEGSGGQWRAPSCIAVDPSFVTAKSTSFYFPSFRTISFQPISFFFVLCAFFALFPILLPSAF